MAKKTTNSTKKVEAAKMDAFGSTKKSKSPAKAESIPFGIDLGTTNSAISIGSVNGQATPIKLENGRLTMPSVVKWLGGDDFLVGQKAYDAPWDDSVVRSVKTKMQEIDGTEASKVTFRCGDEELTLTAVEVSAKILRGLVDQISYLYKNVKDVVVTVPAYFNNVGTKNTMKACELAGLNCLHILKEPTAAALCLDVAKSDSNTNNVLVYDLGGGTFDVSLIQLTDKGNLAELHEMYGLKPLNSADNAGDKSQTKLIEVIDTDGDGHLGGDDYDKEMEKIFIRKFNKKMKELGQKYKFDDLVKENQRTMKRAMHEKKPNATDLQSLVRDYKFTDGTCLEDVQIDLTPADFTEGLMPIYEKTVAVVDRVLEENKNIEVDTIILTGGSTKSVILTNLLTEKYKDKLVLGIADPDLAVADGAGIMSYNMKYGDNAVQIFDILPQSIGILVNDNEIKPIIKRKSHLPATASEVFTKMTDEQDCIELTLYQGNSSAKEMCALLGVIRIDELPQIPVDRMSIVIQMIVDTNSILNIKAVILDEDDPNFRVSRNVTIELNAEVKELTQDEKLIIRWTKHADGLADEQKTELLNTIEQYKLGKVTKKEVATLIKSYK